MRGRPAEEGAWAVLGWAWPALLAQLLTLATGLSPATGVLWFVLAAVLSVLSPAGRIWVFVRLVRFLKEPAESLGKRRLKIYSAFWCVGQGMLWRTRGVLQ